MNQQIVGFGKATLTEPTDELFLWSGGDSIHAGQFAGKVVGQLRTLRLQGRKERLRAKVGAEESRTSSGGQAA